MQETQNLLIAVGLVNPRPSRIFANSRLISIFIALFKAAFCRVVASVSKAKLRLCVNYDIELCMLSV